MSMNNGTEHSMQNGVKHSMQNGSSKRSRFENGNASVDFVQNDFLYKLSELLIEKGFRDGKDANKKVVDFIHPKQLKLRLDLDIKDKPCTDDELLKLCEDTIKYSVKTGHPHFYNQLFAGIDQYGLGGAWLTEALNCSQYTYEVAPVFTLMEETVLKKMRDVIGYSSGDGIFCPGGSVSNMYGLNLARFKKYPEIKSEGMQGLPKICFFTSEHSHYSVKKGASLLGIGMNNAIPVPCNENGEMIPEELEKCIEKAKQAGKTPYLVNGTAGTTVAGAYDDLDAIADICEKYDLWLHVDACWGGGAMMSRNHRHVVKGIHRSDSVAWNAHKMMGTPLQCCAFLTKHEDLLQKCNSANATYLFQQDKFYDVSYDTGDKSIQCGRKVDVFKLWLMWKAHGNTGFINGIENIFNQAKYLADTIRNTQGFRLVYNKIACTNVCFWYIPERLRNKEENDEWWQEISKVAPAIKQRMVEQGTMLVGYQPQGTKVNFFRMVVANLDSTQQDMDFFISEIERLGHDL